MAKIYGNLERASFESLSSDPGSTVVGRVIWNSTEGRAKVADGSAIRALLRNDLKCVIGNSGTAAENIRLHRGAAGVLQFLSGADATAEGSLSTALNQISGRQENYATGSLPSAGNAGRLAFDTTVAFLKVDNGSAWKTLVTTDGAQALTAKDIDGGTASNTSRITLPKDTTTNLTALTRKEGTIVYSTDDSIPYYDDGTNLISMAGGSGAANDQKTLSNVGLATSVGSNALTVALKQADGSTNASGGAPITIAFRSSTLTSGAYNLRTVTGALSVVVSSGSTLGHADGVAQNIYVYAIDNAGTVELAVSSVLFDEDKLHSTTAEGGSGGADSNAVLYSTTARTSVPIRLIGKLVSTQTTAGTWAANMTEVVAGRFELPPVFVRYWHSTTMTVNNSVRFHPDSKDYDNYNAVVTGSGTWAFTAPRDGLYHIQSLWADDSGFPLAVKLGIYATGTMTLVADHYCGTQWGNGSYPLASTTVYLLAGEQFWLDNGTSSDTKLAAGTGGDRNWISITEIPGRIS